MILRTNVDDMLTICNYCALRRIKEDARRQGKAVTVRNNNVYIHIPGVPLNHATDFVAWFMEIPSDCECDL